MSLFAMYRAGHETVSALSDNSVVFGMPDSYDANMLYVDLGSVAGKTVLRVVRVTPSPLQNTDVVRYGPIARWFYAAPPWPTGLDLPSLSQAVLMHRLPESAFPRPSEGIHDTETGIRFGDRELPLFRWLIEQGFLAA